MNQDRHKRKMSAIFSADVVGYSRLMDTDEAWTIKTLDENKKLISNLITDYGGRVIDAIGDNLLAEFSSVINSVECAVKVQQELKKKNDTLVEERRMRFRIGVNLGDVVEEDGRIYGSGVNIASRLEALAEPGGICISGRTYDHIKTKLGLGYNYLGEHNVKNIDEPIRIYRLLMDPDKMGKVIGEKKDPSRSSYRIALSAVIILIFIALVSIGLNIYFRETSEPETVTEQESEITDVRQVSKTIAVLPFVDMSPDKDQEYFSDGIAEELMNQLSKLGGLLVTGRTSSFFFKDKNEDFGVIGERLGVAYILEGSVRKSDNKLRITVQLIKTEDGYHLWSETYDRKLADIFAIQDDIAQSVANALQIKLGVGELGRTTGMTTNIAAYDAYLAGRSYSLLVERDSITHAIEQLEQAVVLDSDFAIGWYTLATAYEAAANLWFAEKAEEFLAKEKAALSRVVELIPDTDLALIIAASQSHDLVEEERLYKKALALNPLDYETIIGYGGMLNDVGRSAEAIEYFQRLLRIEPLDPMAHLFLGWTYEFIGNSDAAVEAIKKGRELANQPWFYNTGLLVLALEENNRTLIDEYLVLLGDLESDFTQVILALLDTPEETEANLRPFLADPARDNMNGRAAFAVWASYFGDHELALQAYRGLIGPKWTSSLQLWRPIHKGMRRLPGFKDLVREIGLYNYWRTTGEWGDFCHPVGDDDFECD